MSVPPDYFKLAGLPGSPLTGQPAPQGGMPVGAGANQGDPMQALSVALQDPAKKEAMIDQAARKGPPPPFDPSDQEMGVPGQTPDPATAPEAIQAAMERPPASEEEVQQKAETNSQFKIALFDLKKYPGMRNLVMYKGKGEIYDFDYEMVNRDHKLLRKRFAFGGAKFHPSGNVITDKCTECGACYEACTFKAIEPGSPYRMIGERCDECGSCVLVCPEDAILQPNTI